MCATCGCSAKAVEVDGLPVGQNDHSPGHSHADGHSHPHGDGHGSHSHAQGAHGHSHEQGGGAHSHDFIQLEQPVRGAATTTVDLEARVLAKNDALAARNRAWFAAREILALNLVSSPGSGKTTLLERTIRDLRGEVPLAVIEGDQATSNDADRIRRAGAPAVQVNTGTGCHLDAGMIERGLAELKPARGAVVLIENVGNLVCPALFDLGERAKVVVLSVTEGEDKPLKYPHMFRAAQIMLLNKIDLLPHLDFDVARALENARMVNPGIVCFQVSARSGEGLDRWYRYLREGAARPAEARAP